MAEGNSPYAGALVALEDTSLVKMHVTGRLEAAVLSMLGSCWAAHQFTFHMTHKSASQVIEHYVDSRYGMDPASPEPQKPLGMSSRFLRHPVHLPHNHSPRRNPRLKRGIPPFAPWPY